MNNDDILKALEKINAHIEENNKQLNKFAKDLFDITNQYEVAFEVTAKAAEELARQGLSAEELIKRLRDALILARISGLNASNSIDLLTKTIESFNSSSLSSTEIVNKFMSVDNEFAISAKELAESISRVGESAAKANISFDDLLLLISNIQQVTARGGIVIGNGLKTIFTRIETNKLVNSFLSSCGIPDASKNEKGSLLETLKTCAKFRKDLDEEDKQLFDTVVGGVYNRVITASLFKSLESS